MKKYCFGIDIGGTTVKCGFFNTEGDLLEKWEIPTRTEENGSRILPDIAQTINDKIAERGLDKAEIEGIGIDVPGPVHEDGHVDFAVNLHWGVVDIVGEMEKLTGIRTKALNDANAAALGECWKGGGAGYHNLIMVTLGTGIGGGIVINDKVIAGAHGAGGEIGHGHATEELTNRATAAMSAAWSRLPPQPGLSGWRRCASGRMTSRLSCAGKISAQRTSGMQSRRVTRLRMRSPRSSASISGESFRSIRLSLIRS